MFENQNPRPVLTSALSMLIFLLNLSSCGEEGSTVEDPTTFEKIELGSEYQGGIIFYLDGTGQHGLVAAKTDQSITDPWYNGNFVTTNALSPTDGKANTELIVKAQGNTGVYAAKICRDYKGGGYSGWFLPSKDQLNILYQNRHLLDNFADQIYWSSTEYDIGSAWVQDFTNGDQYLDNTSDGANVHTRAIREF
jgi:hypothetical protein